jgi:two-component system, OmpR family, sensor histidine kinase KdpD
MTQVKGRLMMIDITEQKAENLLVCIGPGPSSAGLVNSAKSMAAGLHAKWFVVYVEDPKMLMMPESERDRASESLRLAAQLGAETITLSGPNIAEEILNFARERNVSKIIVGKPRRSLWKSIFSGSPVDQLVRMSGEIDVCVMAGEPGKPGEATYVIRPKGADLSDYGTGFLFLILPTILCFLMYPYFQLSNLIMVYLLGVMLTATSCGRRPAILISLLSVLSFDFFFVPPRFTLTVEEAQYIVTFIVMFLVALVISHLTARMQQQTEIARLQERQVAAMHGLSRELASRRGIEEILKVAVQYISEIFDCGVVAMLPDDEGKLNVAAGDPSSVLQKDIVKEMNLARSACDTGRMTGWGSDTFSTTEILCVPLKAANAPLGVLALKPGDPERFLLPEQLQLLESLAKQVALALEVERLTASGSLKSHISK